MYFVFSFCNKPTQLSTAYAATSVLYCCQGAPSLTKPEPGKEGGQAREAAGELGQMGVRWSLGGKTIWGQHAGWLTISDLLAGETLAGKRLFQQLQIHGLPLVCCQPQIPSLLALPSQMTGGQGGDVPQGSWQHMEWGRGCTGSRITGVAAQRGTGTVLKQRALLQH